MARLSKKFFFIVMALCLLTPLVIADPVTASDKECEGLKPWIASKSKERRIQLDSECRVVYVEPPHRVFSETHSHAEKSSTISLSTFDPNLAFNLHSRPNASSIIYLDFDGQTWSSDSWWNGAFSITGSRKSDGYSVDEDASTFTAIERQHIYEVWTMVAEDFAMFDVDVTTERPTGAREVVFLESGSHALILQDNAVQEACGCGGVAHLDVFDEDSPWNRPALNFSRFGTYVAHPIDIAEIISHEVGHNLGLVHDGGGPLAVEYYGGHAMWTPIMGAGRGRGVSTWSYGGYPNAETRGMQRGGNDDFAQMSLYLNLIADEFGDTLETATLLTSENVTSGIQGRITTREDIDVLKLVVNPSDAGTYDITLNPIAFGPNLDPELKVLDSAGNQIALSNPDVFAPGGMTYITSGLGASISLELNPGTYYLRIDGVGQGSLEIETGYDDYASRGNYSLEFAITKSSPTISKVTPKKITAGKRITILGNNLNSSKVYLGKKILKIVSITKTKIVVVAPSRLRGNKFMLRVVNENLNVEVKKEVKRKP